MAFENTMTEQDMDPNTRNVVHGLQSDSHDFEPDLSVDGLSDSMLSRILNLFGSGRS